MVVVGRVLGRRVLLGLVREWVLLGRDRCWEGVWICAVDMGDEFRMDKGVR